MKIGYSIPSNQGVEDPAALVQLAVLAENRLPYMVLLTDPTYGGTTASFATLGDIMIAEPGQPCRPERGDPADRGDERLGEGRKDELPE